MRSVSSNFLGVILSILLCFSFSAIADEETKKTDSCEVDTNKTILLSGWFDWEPYQFIKKTIYDDKLTGLDIDLVNLIGKKIGIEIRSDRISWEQHILAIKEGTKDIAPGATYTLERSKFAYFSEPYRYEENSLFTMTNSEKIISFANINEFLAKVRTLNYKLGVMDGAVYADDKLNYFISNEQNADLIVKNPDDLANLNSLINGEIEGFITDRLVGSSIIMSKNLGEKIKEVPLNIKTPISLMLSKKTISPELLNKINSAITKLKNDGDYGEISRRYLFSILLLQILSSPWFNYIALIGIIAFSLSGVAISARNNMTLFGTYLLSLFPSITALFVRESITSGNDVSLNGAAYYLIVIFIVVIFSFSIIKMLQIFNKTSEKGGAITEFFTKSYIITDAIGQACFVIIGVASATIYRLDPIELWGPIAAFIMANLGCVARDLMTKDKIISIFSGDLNAELSIFWGLIFSIYLKFSSNNPNLDMTNFAVLFILLLALGTRIGVIRYKVPNLKFN